MANMGGLPYPCQGKHAYGEYGVCFECGKRKPKPKSEQQIRESKKAMMRRLRKARKEAGLAAYTFWLTLAQKKAVDKVLKK